MNGKRLRGAPINRWAEVIESRGLSTLALPFLEVLDALGFLAGQLCFMAEPLIGTRSAGPRVQAGLIGEVSDLLPRPDACTDLRRRLGAGPQDDD